MSEFLSMGQYATYIWVSYGITALALILLALLSLRANAAARREVERLRPRRKRVAETVDAQTGQEAG
jgi:heme exporter protein D